MSLAGWHFPLAVDGSGQVLQGEMTDEASLLVEEAASTPGEGVRPRTRCDADWWVAWRSPRQMKDPICWYGAGNAGDTCGQLR